MIVVDTNMVAYLLLGGERTPDARRVLLRDGRWAAPMLWRSEFCNVLAFQLRQKRIGLADALDRFRRAETLLSTSEYRVDAGRVLTLVSSSKCTSYDCEFVALAQELGVPLITSDAQILAEFPDVAMSAVAFAPA